MKESTKSSLEPSPKLLNGVEVRRVWRQEQNRASESPSDIGQNRLSVESGVVENDHRTMFEFREQQKLKPVFKQHVIRGAIVLQRCDAHSQTTARNDIGAVVLLSADAGYDALTDWRTCVLAIETTVDTRLIHVNKPFRLDIFHRFNKGLPKFFVSLTEYGSFFYD